MNFGHNDERPGLVLQHKRDNPEVWEDVHSSHVSPTPPVTESDVKACPSNVLLRGVDSSCPGFPHVDQDPSSPVVCVLDTQKA